MAPVSPLSSSCFLTPTLFGRPRPLRIGSDWLLARDLLLFSMSLVRDESMRSLRMRSVLLRFNSSLSKGDDKKIKIDRDKQPLNDWDDPAGDFSSLWDDQANQMIIYFFFIAKKGSIYWS